MNVDVKTFYSNIANLFYMLFKKYTCKKGAQFIGGIPSKIKLIYVRIKM